MNKLGTIVFSVAIFALMATTTAQSNWWPFSKKKDAEVEKAELVDLVWDDLIPDDFVQPENPFNSMTQDEIDKLLDGSEESEAELARLQEEFSYAPVVEQLDGKRVRIPAYVTPLEFDGQSEMKEFLLVPYVGACIHTPPPPANQVVHAQSSELIKFGNVYDPVWAIGTIHAETVNSNLAESGYRLEVEDVRPYQNK